MSRSASQRAHRLARIDEVGPRTAESSPNQAIAATAVVTCVEKDGLQLQRRSDSLALTARVAVLVGYAPAVGDEVLVAESDVGPVVIAVLRTSNPMVLSAPNDLVLSAPSGSIRIDAALDVAISAERDATLVGTRRAALRVDGAREDEEATPADLASRVVVERKGVTVAGPSVEAHAKRARLISAGADVIAQAIRSSATTIETRARKIDVTAEQVVRRAKDVLDEISGLVETRAGRVRSLVRGAFSLKSKTTTMRSSEDTSVDGRRVLLG